MIYDKFDLESDWCILKTPVLDEIWHYNMFISKYRPRLKGQFVMLS